MLQTKPWQQSAGSCQHLDCSHPRVWFYMTVSQTSGNNGNKYLINKLCTSPGSAWLLACVLAQSGESVVRPAVDRSMVTWAQASPTISSLLLISWLAEPACLWKSQPRIATPLELEKSLGLLLRSHCLLPPPAQLTTLFTLWSDKPKRKRDRNLVVEDFRKKNLPKGTQAVTRLWLEVHSLIPRIAE